MYGMNCICQGVASVWTENVQGMMHSRCYCQSSRDHQWINISWNNSVFKKSSNTCREMLVSRSADGEIFKPVYVF